MRIIDFVSLGIEDMIYVIKESGTESVCWRGTRQDFIRELSAFFFYFWRPVCSFDTHLPGTIHLYI